MEPTTTNILLIILGSVSGLTIIILIALGIKLWRMMNSIHKITRLFGDEADAVRKILKKVREGIISAIEKKLSE